MASSPTHRGRDQLCQLRSKEKKKKKKKGGDLPTFVEKKHSLSLLLRGEGDRSRKETPFSP